VPNQKHSNKQKEQILYTGKNKYIQTKTKQVNKQTKETDKVFVHTPKLK
jgi:hypothetical protein